MRLMPLSSLAPAAIVLIAALGMASTAVAQAPSPDGEIADKAPFKECLDGQTPTTENIPAVDISDMDEIPDDLFVMDTNPYYDEVVIDFADQLSEERILAFGEAMGLDLRLNSPFSAASNLYVAKVEEGAVPYVKDCLRASAPEGKILHIQENFEYRVPDSWRATFELDPTDGDSDGEMGALDFVPDDPLYQFQWNFKQIGAERAWETSTGKDIVVAVIDTGVTVETNKKRGIKVGPDMKDVATVPGYDFVDNSDFVYDGHGHGTHVAGTIAQATNNGFGVAGLAHDAKIMPLRVLNDRGFGSVSDIADAVRFAADNGADVINMSLGGPLPSFVLKRAIDHAHDKGTLVVSAAGNAGKRAPSYPAAYKNSMAIAATQYDQHTTFYSQWGDFVDIAAPGGNTRVDQNGDGRPDGIMQETHPRGGKTDQHEFALYMGTSMASPHVAAAAAMVIAAGVTGPENVKQVLLDTADDSMRKHYDDKEFAERYGAGLLRVDAAVEKAAAMSAPKAQWECGGVYFVEADDIVFFDSADDESLSMAVHFTRLGGAMALLLLVLIGLRRRDEFDGNRRDVALLAGTAGLSAAGLFFLPYLMACGTSCAVVSSLAGALSNPVAHLNAIWAGAGASINPLLASFLLPLGAYALFAGRRTGRFIACGLAIGMAAFALTQAVMMTTDVAWIPGTAGILDRLWLLANGLLSLAIGYFGLKRR